MSAVPEAPGDFEHLWSDRCPLDRSEGGVRLWMSDLIRTSKSYRAGFLPRTGGYLEQPAIVMDAVEVIVNEQDHIESAKARIRQARLEAQRNR